MCTLCEAGPANAAFDLASFRARNRRSRRASGRTIAEPRRRVEQRVEPVAIEETPDRERDERVEGQAEAPADLDSLLGVDRREALDVGSRDT